MDKREFAARNRPVRVRRSLVLPPTDPTERRGRRSGLVATKACPRCGEPVTIDPRAIRVVSGIRLLACTACHAHVRVRLADEFRRPLDMEHLDLDEEPEPRRSGLGLLRRGGRRSNATGVRAIDVGPAASEHRGAALKRLSAAAPPAPPAPTRQRAGRP